ncbi:MAG: hypothetical protein LBE84_11690, partial [Planctomycetota bacterium]|nr:hypothetical protein [Planctomycetota bacterium]
MKNLTNIAMQLSEDEIRQLMRLKKKGGQLAIRLRRRRDKIAAELEKLDRQLARITGNITPAETGRTRGTGKKTAGKPGRKPKGESGNPAGKSGRRPGRKPSRKPAGTRVGGEGETRGRKLSPN